MSQELITLERQMTPLAPHFAQVLGSFMSPDRLIRTIMIAVERNSKLLECDRQSLMNAAYTFATLGLECDGVTGQAYPVPFKDRKSGKLVVQPVIGYLGYNTLGARTGATITGRVVREGDEFDFDEGQGFVHHKRKLGSEDERRIVAAWSRAAWTDRPAAVRVLSIDEILAVKIKSPRGSEPPWADPKIGFPAMAEKTAKRRLRRDMPLNIFQQAARMEEAHEEQGAYAWIGTDGVVVEGDVIAPRHNTETPTAEQLTKPPDLQEEARMAAERGRDAFGAFCKRLTKTQYIANKQYLESLRPIVEGAGNDDDRS